MKYTGLYLGADPEVFVKDASGRNVSAHEFCPGTKDAPVDLGNGVSVQLDGTAIEFNIAPQRNANQFSDAIGTALNKIKALLPAGYELDLRPSVEYDELTWSKIPDSCKELGCNPDWNAYTGKQNPRPDGNSTRLRTGAGHIHLGWINADYYEIDPYHPKHIEVCCKLASNLDNWFLHLESRWDKDTRRRELYGNPGAFRPKPYGMEYRVLSNAWIKYPLLRLWIGQQVENVIVRGLYGEYYHSRPTNLPYNWEKGVFNG